MDDGTIRVKDVSCCVTTAQRLRESGDGYIWIWIYAYKGWDNKIKGGGDLMRRLLLL